jgi:hypothetical protein
MRIPDRSGKTFFDMVLPALLNKNKPEEPGLSQRTIAEL